MAGRRGARCNTGSVHLRAAPESLLAFLARSATNPTSYNILIKGLLFIWEAPWPSDRLVADSVPGRAGSRGWRPEGLAAKSPLPASLPAAPARPVACCLLLTPGLSWVAGDVRAWGLSRGAQAA